MEVCSNEGKSAARYKYSLNSKQNNPISLNSTWQCPRVHGAYWITRFTISRTQNDLEFKSDLTFLPTYKPRILAANTRNNLPRLLTFCGQSMDLLADIIRRVDRKFPFRFCEPTRHELRCSVHLSMGAPPPFFFHFLWLTPLRAVSYSRIFFLTGRLSLWDSYFPWYTRI